MKKLILISFIITLNMATVTNNGATITIGEGVTFKVDDDFVNNGTLVNNGTFAISGQFHGDLSGLVLGYWEGTDITFFGDSTTFVWPVTYKTITIEGDGLKILCGDWNAVNNYDCETFSSEYSRYGWNPNMLVTTKLALDGVFDLNDTDPWNDPLLELFNPAYIEFGDGELLNGTVKRNGGGIHNIIEFLSDEENGCPDYGCDTGNLGAEVQLIEGTWNNLATYYSLTEDPIQNGVPAISPIYYFNGYNGNGDDYFYNRVAIQYSDYDISDLDVEDLGIFRRFDDVWVHQGGVIAGDYIVSDEFDADPGYARWTLGKVGCTEPGAANYDPMAFGGEYECTYNYAENFAPGYNLMSFYSMDDEDNSIANVMSTLDMSMSLIGEGIASTVHPVLGWVGSITNIDRNRGYWLYLYEEDTYELENGSPNYTDMTYELHIGNNLISYSGPSDTPIDAAMPSESSCTSVIGMGEATTYVDGLGWIGSLSDLKPWAGYWLTCANDESFQFEGHSALPRPMVPVEIPEFLTFEQSPKQAFYFIESIEDAEVGRDFLISKKGDDILGVVAYSEYAAVPAMGAFEDVVGYEEGDQVSLQLYNSDEDLYYYLNGQNLEPWSDLAINMVGPMTTTPIVPEGYKLHNAYPNPFNPVSTIQFDLPENVHTELIIYDMTGRLVETLIAGELKAGYHHITWDASGKASGMYLLKLHAGSFIETQKITLLK